MKLTKTKLKQLIKEELASLAEIEEEAEDLRLLAAEDAQRRADETEYRPIGEAEYANIVVAFQNILDGFLKDDFPDEYDFYGELKSIADYAMAHRDRWEAAAPERRDHASEMRSRIAASQAERGLSKE